MKTIDISNGGWAMNHAAEAPSLSFEDIREPWSRTLVEREVRHLFDAAPLDPDFADEDQTEDLEGWV